VLGPKSRDIGALRAVRAPNERVDVPESKTGAIASGSKPTGQLIQRVDRLLRPAEGRAARLYVLYAVRSESEGSEQAWGDSA